MIEDNDQLNLLLSQMDKVKDVGRKISRGGVQWKPRPRNCTNKPPSILSVAAGGLGGAQDMHPRLTSSKRYIKTRAPCKKWRTFFWKIFIFEKIPNFLENFGPFLCEKTLYPAGSHMALITSLPLNVNKLSKEMRWLVSVGMFS